jgi:hypothetical protein
MHVKRPEKSKDGLLSGVNTVMASPGANPSIARLSGSECDLDLVHLCGDYQKQIR